MRNQPRDVTGGSKTWGAMIPGYNLANYILGYFSVPIETILRRDFGERYYTKSNFIAGLAVLIFFNIIRSLLAKLDPRNLFGGGAELPAESWMWIIIKIYFVLGLIHFFTMWVRDVTGTAQHSYDSGKSWLLGLGKIIIKILNLILGFIVRIVAAAMPNQARTRLLNNLPVLRDVGTFTERFVEPAVVLFASFIAAGFGETSVSIWLLFSFTALNLSTGIRHQQERCYMLDMRDQMIEARVWQEFIEGIEPSRAGHLQRTIEETMSEVEKSPAMIEVIREDKPSLANAIAAIQARKRTEAPPQTGFEVMP